MPRINIITSHYVPEVTAAAYRMESFAKSLSAKNQVTVFALTEIGVCAKEEKVVVNDNLTIHYLNLPGYKKSSLIIRTFYEIYYSFKLVRKAKRTPADLQIGTSPFMFLIPAMILLGIGPKKMFDVRDLTWRYIPTNHFHQRVFRYMITRMMKHFLRKFDQVTVTNNHEKQWMIKEAGIDESSISIISNGLAKEKFDIIVDLEYDTLSKPLTITYVGNIGNGQNMRGIVDALANLKDVSFNLIGDGNDYEFLKEYIKRNKIGNIHLTGKLSWNEVLAYYKYSTVLIARLDENFKSAIPSKLFEYLSTGLPVIYCGEGEAANLLRRFEHCYLLPSSDYSGLRQTILHLQNKKHSLSIKNRSLVNQLYIRELINLKLENLVFELLGIEISEVVLTPAKLTEADPVLAMTAS